MKIFNYLFLSLLIAVTFSCGDDEDVTPPTDDLLVGTWDLQTLDYTVEQTTSITATGETIMSTSEGEGSDISARVELREDMTYMSSGSYTIVLVSMISGYSFEQEVVVEDFLGAGAWRRDGDTLYSTDNTAGQEVPATIIELTDSSFIMDFSVRTVSNDQGFVVTSVIDGRYTFTR